MFVYVDVSTDHMMTLAKVVLKEFGESVVALRQDWLDELLDRVHVRFGPFIGDHPKAVHFASLLKRENQYYADEACVQLFDEQERLAELSKVRMKLDELLLSQLLIANEGEVADNLLQVLENERLQLATARCRFTSFGLGLKHLVLQMERAYRVAREQEDEHDMEARRLAALIMRTVRLERQNIELYTPSAP